MTLQTIFITSILVAATPLIALDPPPRIMSTSPNFWQKGVAAAQQKVVSVTFDQTMRSGFWDFLGTNILSPSTNYKTEMGNDRKSFSMDVALLPGKVYVMGLNERGIPGVGFQNEKGLSVAPAYLVFQTAGTPAQEDLPPQVLNTSPANAVQDVNPATTRSITVAFGRAMNTRTHGLHLFEDKKPVDIKGATFIYSPDGKIFTLDYRFKPSTHYEVEMNGTTDLGFAGTNRVPLWPVHFSFVTGQPH